MITLNVGRLDGDSGGMLHIGKSQRLIIQSAPTEFPSSFRVYEHGYFQVPPVMLLRNLYYPKITIEGAIKDLNELSIGKGTQLEIAENVRMFNDFVFLQFVFLVVLLCLCVLRIFVLRLQILI